MLPRVSPTEVRSVISAEEDTDLTLVIETAHRLTNYVETQDEEGILSSMDLLVSIETYLAAHFYAVLDPQYREKKVGDAMAIFQGLDGMRLESTAWGQQAIALDVTGTLAALNAGPHKAKLVWLGKTEAEQTDWRDW